VKRLAAFAGLGALLASPGMAWAAGAIEGTVEKQGLNITAVVIFLLFVLFTLGITYRAARQTKSASDFYAAGGGISAGQNGLAIAGDYMSAASFLGISGLVFSNGFRSFCSPSRSGYATSASSPSPMSPPSGSTRPRSECCRP